MIFYAHTWIRHFLDCLLNISSPLIFHHQDPDFPLANPQDFIPSLRDLRFRKPYCFSQWVNSVLWAADFVRDDQANKPEGSICWGFQGQQFLLFLGELPELSLFWTSKCESWGLTPLVATCGKLTWIRYLHTGRIQLESYREKKPTSGWHHEHLAQTRPQVSKISYFVNIHRYFFKLMWVRFSTTCKWKIFNSKAS